MRPGRLQTIALIGVVALAASVIATRAQTPGEEVQRLLERMNAAVEELNYRGTYVQVDSRNAQMFRIAHRYANGKVRERITTAGDAAREILRENEIVYTVNPEERRVIVEEVQRSSAQLTGVLMYNDALSNLYAVRTVAKGEVAGRPTQYVSIQPRDNYRYGYRLWLDQATGLPLKSQVIDSDGQAIEQILFTDIEIVDAIPEAEILPAIGTDGYEWVRRIKAKPDASSDEIWGATRIPDGFRLSISRLSLLAGSTYPVHHLVYTDGLATVSVFIADPRSEANQDFREGLWRRGSLSVYSLSVDGRLATAVGEVPPQTVKRIATSLDAH
jgi:sigma-E factor negative regulatory protein RseB